MFHVASNNCNPASMNSGHTSSSPKATDASVPDHISNLTTAATSLKKVMQQNHSSSPSTGTQATTTNARPFSKVTPQRAIFGTPVSSSAAHRVLPGPSRTPSSVPLVKSASSICIPPAALPTVSRPKSLAQSIVSSTPVIARASTRSNDVSPGKVANPHDNSITHTVSKSISSGPVSTSSSSISFSPNNPTMSDPITERSIAPIKSSPSLSSSPTRSLSTSLTMQSNVVAKPTCHTPDRPKSDVSMGNGSCQGKSTEQPAYYTPKPVIPAAPKPNMSLYTRGTGKQKLPERPFMWSEYLDALGAIAAPPQCFKQSEEILTNEFEIGMKIEARDPRARNCWCLATVISVMGPRIQLRCDGTGTNNDFCELIDSCNIRPYGSMDYHTDGDVRGPPVGFTRNLSNYLKFVEKIVYGNDVKLAPASCFKPEPPTPPKNIFKPGMKLEAIDRKNDVFICPATIKWSRNDKIFVEIDGWKDGGYEVDYYSRSIFPVGWCAKNQHTLAPPNDWPSILLSPKPITVPNENGCASSSGSDQKIRTIKSNGAKNSQTNGNVKRKNKDTSSGTKKKKSKSSDIEERKRLERQRLKLERKRLLESMNSTRSSISNASLLTAAVKESKRQITPTTNISIDQYKQRIGNLEHGQGIEVAKQFGVFIFPDSPDHASESGSSPTKKKNISQEVNSPGLSKVTSSSSPLKIPSSNSTKVSKPSSLKVVSKATPAPPVVDSETSVPKLPPFNPNWEPAKVCCDGISVGMPILGWSTLDVVNFLQSRDSNLRPHLIAFLEQEIDGAALAEVTTEQMMRYLDLKLGPILKINTFTGPLLEEPVCESEVSRKKKSLWDSYKRKHVPSHLENKPLSTWSVSDVISALKADQTLKPHLDRFRYHEIDGQAFELFNVDLMIQHMGLKLGPAVKINAIMRQYRPVKTNS